MNEHAEAYADIRFHCQQAIMMTEKHPDKETAWLIVHELRQAMSRATTVECALRGVPPPRPSPT